MLSLDPDVDEAGRLIEDLLLRMRVSDALTLEHSRAVSVWCARIARRMGLSEAEVTHVERCGLLHDLGKMEVPAQILHAPRKLSTQEWVIVQAHSVLGEEIVKGQAALQPFAATVRSHHERLDGTGYPDGLVGSQISLATRIVSVADAFDAMTGYRSYRPAMSSENAMDRLYSSRGSQFDAIVVDAMIEVVRRAEER